MKKEERNGKDENLNFNLAKNSKRLKKKKVDSLITATKNHAIGHLLCIITHQCADKRRTERTILCTALCTWLRRLVGSMLKERRRRYELFSYSRGTEGRKSMHLHSACIKFFQIKKSSISGHFLQKSVN